MSGELFELPETPRPRPVAVASPGTAGDGAAGERGAPGTGTPRLSATQIADLLGRPRPTTEQVAVIEAPLEPALVVAGAGSGKTETMAARVVWLIANGLVAPDAVLGLTFTRKAAGELAERVQVRLAQLARARGTAASALSLLDRPTVATYNAYAASLVADHGLRVGVEPGARLLGEAQQWQLASEVVESWDDDLGTDRAVSTVVAAVLGLSGALGEHLLEPDAARERLADIVATLDGLPLGPRQRARTKEVTKLVGDVAERVRLLDVVAEYRRRKRATDSLDFGDQVALAARLAREVPVVGTTERSRYRVVLLDEYQDTSHAQVELLAGLFGDGHPVTAVGDPHQSIYGWRGASAGGLARFPERFHHRDGGRSAVHLLSTSWRNDAAVLDAANVTSAPLREPGTGTSVVVPPLALRQDAGPGVVRAHVATTAEEEAAAVAELVASRWRPAGAPGGRVTAAVLCRKRSQFPAIEVALRRRGLPVEVVGLGGLLTTPEIVDVVSLLEAVHDPSRGDALVRLLTGPRVNLGAADLHALGSHAADLARRDGGPSGRPHGAASAVVEGDVVDHRSVVDALDDLPEPGAAATDGRVLSPAARNRLGVLAGTLRALRSLTYLSLPELVVEAERALGLDVEAVTTASLLAPGRVVDPDAVSDRAREHLDAFRDVAATFAQTADVATLGAFLAWLGVAASRENGLDLPVREPDPDAVQVVTAHAAKGLEWDVVAVPGLVDGVFPTVARSASGTRADSGWLTDVSQLPYPLRGDAADLPAFRYDLAGDTKDLVARRDEFRQACGEHLLAEERRLAYVAFTRARHELFLSASWWQTGSTPRALSPFLLELVEAGAVRTDGWAAPPEAGATNPLEDVEVTATWPAPDDAAPGSARAVLRATAERVGRAAAERAAARVGTSVADDTGGPALLTAPEGHLHDEDGRDLVATARVLLAERADRTGGAVALPPHLSASGLVRLASDREEFALHLRRPVPSEPTVHARRGTSFHLWAERYFTSASLLDVEDLPGADDSGLDPDLDLDALRRRFLASSWAARTPLAVEVDVETPVGGTVLRSRIDAVFPELPQDAGGADDAVVVVDWKTGRAPSDPTARRHREVQLAVYRLAWSRWSGLPLEKVNAAFYHVASDETVRPERLLDEAEIEALLRG
ncbi:ATP-dependent DNA helicase [Cellulosimicrobium marinum]|uniref:ATP-dependent DNA helicase n=1 Tax=Cellulosimicrobium marinum TaxID=1638992 RepID=UPI001E4C8642|nr:ATP-dependent DNA helicase [Cellulosimicrobium marinum]MCB7136626.1 ATP-dependent helicase [Cellulosimicrobium marinum]